LFVDIHNHILPGIDDGSPTMEYAIETARLAYADGTDTMIATPHRSWWHRPDAPPEWVKEQVQALRTELEIAGVPLTVLPGVEIPVGPRVADDLAAGKLLTIGDAGRWALIEPPFDNIPKDALDNLKAVLDAGFKIALAHPERNAVIQTDLSFVEACADLGINLQVTTGSLLGRFGQKAQATAEAILHHSPDWQIVIASDTHDHVKRPPNLMSDARNAAAKIVGPYNALEMVDPRPRAMITAR
jgi:protein-tyrosine phosphatase